jgi:hypothetical protein
MTHTTSADRRWSRLTREKDRNDAAALKRRCPRCKARPGEACRVAGLVGLHGARRIRVRNGAAA